MPDYDLGKVVGDDGVTPTIDSSLSDSSTNPVQNKVIKSALDTKQNVATAFSGDYNDLTNKPTIATSVENGNNNAVSSDAVYDYISNIIGDIQEYVNR